MKKLDPLKRAVSRGTGSRRLTSVVAPMVRSAVVPMLALVVVLAAAPVWAESADGVTEPFLVVDVAAAEPGVIADTAVQEGDRVREGDLLATLDLDVLYRLLEIARARSEAHGQLDAAAAEIQLCRDRLEKLAELRESGHARETELQRARKDVAVAEAKMLAAREEQLISRLDVARIQAQIERRKIRSPIDGVVTEVHRDAGEYVDHTRPEVVTVVQLDPLRVVFPVPAQEASGLSVGQRVTLSLPESGRQAEGVVECVAPINDAECGTIRIKVLLDNGAGQYRSGVRCVLNLGNPAPGRLSLDRSNVDHAALQHEPPGAKGKLNLYGVGTTTTH